MPTELTYENSPVVNYLVRIDFCLTSQFTLKLMNRSFEMSLELTRDHFLERGVLEELTGENSLKSRTNS